MIPPPPPTATDPSASVPLFLFATDPLLDLYRSVDRKRQIIAVVDGVYVSGKYQVVAINRGKRHGLVPGNVLGTFYRGETVRDRFDRQSWSAYTANYDMVRLPDERSGTIMLFSVHDRMSYGLVMQSSQVIRVGD